MWIRHDRLGIILGFNEAAGIPRGRHSIAGTGRVGGEKASMRPRVFPAEDVRCFSSLLVASSRFNEAAGIPRGRLGHSTARMRTPGPLQ